MSPIQSIPKRSIDTVKPLKVICAGAGISGILTAIRLPQRLRSLELVIYDKNEELGGTWYENKYPGCACDIPAHCYQLSFESNPAWSQFYASAPEILEYWKRVAEKYDVRKYMRLSHQILEARWHEESTQWILKVQRVESGETFTDTADVFISATGVLNEWRMPNIPGLQDFEGTVLHSAAWDEKFEYKNKRLAVIGAGSSGIQIVPNIQPEVKQLDHYIRGRTWIATGIAAGEVKKRNDTGANFDFSESEIRDWEQDPELYLEFRKTLEQELQSGHILTVRGTTSQNEAREMFTTLMRERLKTKPEIADHLVPDFPPLCKRLTPGPGYLESLTKKNVEVIARPIERVVRNGIKTDDGRVREVDAIVCATGFDTSFTKRFPVYGRGGIKLGDKWQKTPDTYLSATTDEFPNYFMFLGPNSALGSGNLLMLLERVAGYVTQCLEKMQNDNIKTMAPSARSVSNFSNFCDTYFEGTVFSDECSSWYKSGGPNGRVSALWPGSSLHAIKALEHPRWEDFEYTYVDENEFSWFGDGWSERDRSEMDRSYYLDPQHMDIPPAIGKKASPQGERPETSRSML